MEKKPPSSLFTHPAVMKQHNHSFGLVFLDTWWTWSQYCFFLLHFWSPPSPWGNHLDFQLLNAPLCSQDSRELCLFATLCQPVSILCIFRALSLKMTACYNGTGRHESGESSAKYSSYRLVSQKSFNSQSSSRRPSWATIVSFLGT